MAASLIRCLLICTAASVMFTNRYAKTTSNVPQVKDSTKEDPGGQGHYKMVA